MDFRAKLVVKPGKPFTLKDRDPKGSRGLPDKQAAEKLVAESVQRLADLQYRLWAENQRAVLIVLQGMDTSGKDGTIKHVMTGFDPQGCRVVPFKKPSEIEADHDFLWRIHEAVPARGEVAIFNRSHYEDVLITRVHGMIDKAECARRYRQINDFEQYLTDHGTVIIKFMLHISKEEQRDRLIERLKDPEKRWKFSAQDIAERKRWDDYQSAYESVLEHCSTRAAPWHVIPSDRKWLRNLAVAGIVVETMKEMDPRLPKPTIDAAAFMRQLK
jgi:PPK2 family polyphosphate:nucleotide phosphotransferase